SPQRCVFDRARRRSAPLALAKAALIGYAARDSNRPGSLPCPDPKLVADGTPMGDGLLTWDGVATTNGMPFNCTDSDSSTRIGRLPWRTLGLPELRDGDGELLWYVVSPRFRAPGTSPLNSDVLGDIQTRTSGNLVIASNLVALVIAPGRAVGTQVRPSNHPAQYLELQDPKPGPDATPAPAGPVYQYRLSVSGNSNDSILPISHRDLFDVVDRAVHTRIRDRIAPKLKDLARVTWGIVGDVNYPFAVPAGVIATSPPAGADPLSGRAGTRWGLLPVEQNAAAIAAATFPSQWGTPAPIVAHMGGTASFTASTNCSLPTTTRLACTVEATGAPGDSLSYQIDATVLNAGRRLVSITRPGRGICQGRYRPATRKAA
ncbi:MAG: hypothetical protein HC807_05315, partial [Gammaproteobacteria bacterium]|nr:hypothetical protein [Gammaproteobacteria bacterium]